MSVRVDNPLVGKVIMTCLAGSKAYGTSLPTSDTDIRGIFVAPPKSIRTPWHTITEYTLPDEEDGKIYELSNFMKLFLDMNPNILELMFVREEEILSSTPEYWVLRSAAKSLLNSNVAFRFSGYAMSQLNRIKGHNKWINNPQPKEVPVQREFMKVVQNFGSLDPDLLDTLDKKALFVPYGNNMYGAVINDSKCGLFNKDGSIRLLDYTDLSDEVKNRHPEVIVRYLDNEHKTAKERHRNYWEWVNNRNAVRHELEEQFGYDTKHAMHLVRLMRMAEEILSGKGVQVFREDADELLGIRAGKWTLDEVLSWAEDQDHLVREVLYKTTPLPKRSDLNKATELLMQVQDMAWGGK